MSKADKRFFPFNFRGDESGDHHGMVSEVSVNNGSKLITFRSESRNRNFFRRSKSNPGYTHCVGHFIVQFNSFEFGNCDVSKLTKFTCQTLDQPYNDYSPYGSIDSFLVKIWLSWNNSKWSKEHDLHEWSTTNKCHIFNPCFVHQAYISTYCTLVKQIWQNMTHTFQFGFNA